MSDLVREWKERGLDKLTKEEKLKLFNEFLEFVRKKVEGIPISVFNIKLGPLETVVKYLKEEKRFNYIKISKILHRSVGVVGVSYRKALKKHKNKLDCSSDLVIPYSIFKKNETVFESIIKYMKDKMELSFNDIAKMLKRNYRTIWTVYNRRKKR